MIISIISSFLHGLYSRRHTRNKGYYHLLFSEHLILQLHLFVKILCWRNARNWKKCASEAGPGSSVSILVYVHMDTAYTYLLIPKNHWGYLCHLACAFSPGKHCEKACNSLLLLLLCKFCKFFVSFCTDHPKWSPFVYFVLCPRTYFIQTVSLWCLHKYLGKITTSRYLYILECVNKK